MNAFISGIIIGLLLSGSFLTAAIHDNITKQIKSGYLYHKYKIYKIMEVE